MVPERVSMVVPRVLTVPESVEREVSSQRITPERAFCARVSVKYRLLPSERSEVDLSPRWVSKLVLKRVSNEDGKMEVKAQVKAGENEELN